MPNQSTFVVRRFRNRNGALSWRVDGRLNGLRIRRNFKTREEAAAERAALELKALGLESGLRNATTFLSDEQLREAEAAMLRLRGGPRSLTFLLDYALGNYREPACKKLLSEAAETYLAEKSREHNRGVISKPHLTTIRRHLAVLKAHFPAATMADLSAPRLTAYLQHGMPALKTYNNRRGVISTFLKFAFQQDWIAASPIEKIA